MPPKKSYQVTLVGDGHIPVPFDPKALFGKARAPVQVTINGHRYHSTIFAMGGEVFVPLRRSHREAAGLVGNETVRVTLELDEAERVVELPAELERALKAAPGALAGWRALSYTRQREQVEGIAGAKRPETRARRLGAAVELAVERAAKGK